MTTSGLPAFGPADPRPAADRAADRAAAAGLVARMTDQSGAGDFRAQVLHHLQERRSHREDYPQFDVVANGHPNSELVIRPGRLVMLRSTYDGRAMRAILAARGVPAGAAHPVAGLDDRLVCLHLDGDDLAAVRQEARAESAPVEFSHVAEAMGVVKKATPPVASAGASPPPPAGPASLRPVCVTVIDTGISHKGRGDGWLTTIPETSENTDGLDLLPRPNHYLDFAAGHGTFVAGIVSQVAPRAEVVVRRAVDTDGMATTLDLAVAMVEAARAGADILSLSFAVETEDDTEPLPFRVALEIIQEMRRTTGRDIVVVAAAGNNGGSGADGEPDRRSWPAASPGVLAVSGLTQDLQGASWATKGDWVDCSTIAEGVRSTFPPGTPDHEAPFRDDVQQTFPDNAWALWVGTSFAAPQVAGAIADLADTYGVSVSAARNMLLAGCERLPGYGRKLEILPRL